MNERGCGAFTTAPVTGGGAVQIKDLMRTRNLVSVRPDDDLAVAAQIMRWAGVRHLPVLEGTEVVGVLTERDLLRHRAEAGSRDDAELLVRTFMTRPPETIGPDEDVAAACAMMVARRIGCLPVVDGGKLVGIVTTTDLLGSQLAARLAPSPATITRVEVAMKREPPTVAAYAPLLEAVGIMVDRDVRHVVVIDEHQRVVGIVTDRDVRTAIGDPLEALRQELTELEELKVAGVMTTDVLTVRDDARLSDVARQFVDERVGALPVVDARGRLVGIVSYVDVIRALLLPGDGRESTAPAPANQPPAAV
jgi:acetoin utilization protein AcuB